MPRWNLGNHDGEKGNQPVKETGKQKPVVRGKPQESFLVVMIKICLFFFLIKKIFLKDVVFKRVSKEKVLPKILNTS